MATGGGKPGFATKAFVSADQHSGQIIVTPQDATPALWKYFYDAAEAGTSEFVVDFQYPPSEHHHGGNDEPKDS